MKTALAIALLLICFGIVGRIDYECALISAHTGAGLSTRTAGPTFAGWAR
jgi:hypothetical protein